MVGEPGTLLAIQGQMVVALQDGALNLEVFQLEGRKRVTAQEFLNGAQLRPGMRFLR
jgi:methionyl-tRNA formyltransferase